MGVALGMYSLLPGSEDTLKIVEANLQDLYEFPGGTPVESAEAALGYAIRLPDVELALRKPTSHGYKKWRVKVQLTKTTAQSSWTVRITSVGRLPRFDCVATFDSDGVRSGVAWPDNYCSYEK